MYFLIALLPALLYGSMGVILMKLGGDSRQQTVGLAAGSVTVAGILALALGVDSSPRSMLIALAAGIVVGLAIFFQLRGFHKIGVSRVMPLTTGGQLIGISLIGVFVFGEWRGSIALPVGLFGLLLVVVGVVLTTWEEKDEDEGAQDVFAAPYDPVPIVDQEDNSGSTVAPAKISTRPEQWASGVFDTIVSTAFFIAFPIIIRYWEIDPLRSFIFQALGIAIVSVILTFPVFTPALGLKDNRWSKYTLRAMLPGAMWGVGVVIMQFSQITVGVAVGFSLSQLSVIISTFGGIWVLGEKRTHKEMVTIAIGVLVLVAGALMLGWAKTLDVG